MKNETSLLFLENSIFIFYSSLALSEVIFSFLFKLIFMDY